MPSSKTSLNVQHPACKRMCRRAGIKRMSGDIYGAVDKWTSHFVQYYLDQCRIIAGDRPTLSSTDLETAIENSGHFLAAGWTKKFSQDYRTPSEKTKRPGASKKKRTRPGNGALREIRKQQANSSSFAMHKTTFEKFIRSLVPETTRLSGPFKLLFLLIVEYFIIEQLSFANEIALRCKRITVEAKDFQLVTKMHFVFPEKVWD